jgi:hypothetical protein
LSDCQSLWIERSGGGLHLHSIFDRHASTDQRHELRRVGASPVALGPNNSLSAVTSHAARDPAPFVTPLRRRTVANVGSS